MHDEAENLFVHLLVEVPILRSFFLYYWCNNFIDGVEKNYFSPVLIIHEISLFGEFYYYAYFQSFGICFSFQACSLTGYITVAKTWGYALNISDGMFSGLASIQHYFHFLFIISTLLYGLFYLSFVVVFS